MGDLVLQKGSALVLGIILLIVSAVVIIVNGNTYTLRINDKNLESNIDVIRVKIEDDTIVKCIDKSFENDTLKIKLASNAKGKTSIIISNLENSFSVMHTIYVHTFGIITFNEYMGDSSGSIIIPIAITIWLIYVWYLLFLSYRKSTKENMYQYKNIAYLGLIIFVSFSIISQLLALSHYTGIINTINGILNMFSFAMVLLPVAFIVSLLVIVSNIVLIRKEGFNLTNILGLILGTGLCFSTMLPEIMYQTLYSATWIDIHNQNGIGLYFYNFVESSIYIAITYIECILIGTIIMGIKAAKHIPKLDKDVVIILGCQIKKDGTLTNLLKARVDRAISFCKMQKEIAGKGVLFVPSGGKGDDEVMAEAQAMKNYLLEQGIEERNIIVED